MSSIQGRVLLGTTLALAATLLGAGAALYALVRESLVAEVDRALVAKARLLSSMVEQEREEVDLDDLDLTELDPEPGSYLQLQTPSASGEPRVLYRSSSLGEATLSAPGLATREPTTTWIDPLPAQVRGRAVVLEFAPRVEHRRRGEPLRLVMILARETRELDQALSTLRSLLLGVGAATALVAGLVQLVVVRRSLRPLRGAAEEIARIDEERLDLRLDTSGPAELRPAVQRVNELLERLEAAFGRERAFSSEVAHELRTPLAGLRTTLEVAGSRVRTGEEQAAARAECLAMVGQLQAMVERLLQLARLESSRARPELQAVGLADAALDAWRPFAAPAAARGLEVRWDLDPELHARVDPTLLDLILRNLLENAVTHSPQGASVRVATRAEGQEAALEVQSSGSPLTQAEAEQARARFWRKDAARGAGGCGLGLALVDRAARALQGRLALTSQPGGWFTARVELPLAAEHAPVPASVV